MHSLRFKWIATLLLTSLVGVILVGLFAYRTTVTGYGRLREEQAQTSFVASVTTYYRNHGGWEGIDAWLRENRSPSGAPERFGPPQFFALADASGAIVAGSGPYHLDQRVNAQQASLGIPIVVDGKRVGTALLAAPQPGLDLREQGYLESTNRALLLGAAGAILVAIVIGIILSQHFLRPLTDLTRAITAMRHGDLNQQVEIRTRDELGELARAFNQMSAEVHHANQLRKQMTADIAHDLRTPLMVITGTIEALRDGTLKPTPPRLESMHQEAVLLKRLVEDLRTLSLSDAGELRLLTQPLDPRDLVEQVGQSFEPVAREREIGLRVEAGEPLPPVEVDRDRMLQVLANLVRNALVHTPAGGVVTLRAHRDERSVHLSVVDTGPGIEADKLPNIFERLYHVEESRSQVETGLGLAIARSIVEAHHGAISAESRIGLGTTITVTLPIASF